VAKKKRRPKKPKRKVYYPSYIKSKKWIGKRLAWKRRYGWKDGPPCFVCWLEGFENLKTQMHHVTYKRLGKEWMSDLVPLCQAHHKRVHDELNFLGSKVEKTFEVIRLMSDLSAEEMDESMAFFHNPELRRAVEWLEVE
jgi:5-methylcytosine-specific restriction endonuclease McrA